MIIAAPPMTPHGTQALVCMTPGALSPAASLRVSVDAEPRRTFHVGNHATRVRCGASVQNPRSHRLEPRLQCRPWRRPTTAAGPCQPSVLAAGSPTRQCSRRCTTGSRCLIVALGLAALAEPGPVRHPSLPEKRENPRSTRQSGVRLPMRIRRRSRARTPQVSLAVVVGG
jgi:hypothetical protein